MKKKISKCHLYNSVQPRPTVCIRAESRYTISSSDHNILILYHLSKNQYSSHSVPNKNHDIMTVEKLQIKVEVIYTGSSWAVMPW